MQIKHYPTCIPSRCEPHPKNTNRIYHHLNSNWSRPADTKSEPIQPGNKEKNEYRSPHAKLGKYCNIEIQAIVTTAQVINQHQSLWYSNHQIFREKKSLKKSKSNIRSTPNKSLALHGIQLPQRDTDPKQIQSIPNNTQKHPDVLPFEAEAARPDQIDWDMQEEDFGLKDQVSD